MTFKKNISDTGERVTNIPLPGRRAVLFVIGLLLSATWLLTSALHAEVQADATSACQPAPQDMVLIPAGEFVMGNEGAYADEMPRHTVTVSAFFLDEYEVTNAQFSTFVKATGYVTKAERDGHCWAYFQGETDWEYASGTNWRHPQGPGSSMGAKMNHPVVCISWDDAAAYAKWAGKRLSTEAEWEYAARAGSHGHFVARTDGERQANSHHASETQLQAVSDQSPSSKSHAAGSHHETFGAVTSEVSIDANVWEGHWPEHNRLDDGFHYTAPVGSYAANGMGVSDMLGNVWEWTADWYDSSYYAGSPTSNPQGPPTGKKRIARGGSWFCSPNYCGAYSTHYRGASPPDHAFNNVGFRCAMDVSTGKK